MAQKTTPLHKVSPQVERLQIRGVKSVIPLFKGKNPGYEGWQKITDDEAQAKVWTWAGGKLGEGEGENINWGIRLGPQWGGIVDIDLDSAESRQLAKYYLPESACFGRGGVVTHYLYNCSRVSKDKFPQSKRYQWDKRDEKSVLLELRGSGQSMGPGSVHPVSGETIEWMNDLEVREVEAEELVRGVNCLAAASLLLRDWESGGRDELAVCLVGSMVRGGWEDHDIDRFLEGILAEAGDEEGGKRLKAERLREELRTGGRVPGLKRLKELCTGGGLGSAGFDRIVEWLELGGGDIVEEINGEYAVVALRGGGVALMKESGGEGVEFLDRTSFGLMWANRMVQWRGREVTADKFWLGHSDRREYLGGVVFKPGKVVREDEYNLWRGFAVEEVEGGDWSLFREHLLGVVCGGDVEVFNWLIGWMAHRVQRPWEVPQSAVVLVGERGDGKSSVFKIFGRLFGRHYMTVTNPRHFMGNFNSHMMDKVLVLADEAVWGGDKVNEGVLKVMISEDRRIIEIKGRDAFEVDNCTAYGICSNNDWVVPVGRQERRFLILRVGSERQGDFAYWDKLYAGMDLETEVGRNGLGGMLYDLRRVDLEGRGSGSGGREWRGNRPPSTAELRVQQRRGMEHWVQFVLWQVEECEVDLGCDDGIWADLWWEEYRDWMDDMGWRCETEAVFWRCIERMFSGVWTKVRGKRVVNRFVLKNGVHSECVKRNRYRFSSGWRDKLKAFIG